MLSPSSQTKIYLSTGATDMRKGINGLLVIAEEELAKKATNGALFIFRGKRSDRVKILFYDGGGFCLYYKILERGKFVWPSVKAKGVIKITNAQLSMLLEGIDWRSPNWSAAPEERAANG